MAVLHFKDLPDPRVARSKQHSLVDIVSIALSAVIAGAESFYEIEGFGHMERTPKAGSPLKTLRPCQQVG